ncbi:MAG TPA: hypothetical protein PKA49_00070 [Tepidiformaceae bacterium]|nr:hypothetical protein [Tepidiformaceae bacterium]
MRAAWASVVMAAAAAFAGACGTGDSSPAPTASVATPQPATATGAVPTETATTVPSPSVTPPPAASVPLPAAPFDDAAGYGGTVAAAPILRTASGIEAAAGTRRRGVAAVIEAVTVNGTRQRFAGCYSTWRAAEGVSADPADERWHIEEATIAPVAAADSVPALLDHGCDGYRDRVANFGASIADRTSPVAAATAFFDAIRRGDFDRASSYILEGKRQPLDQLRADWADTAKLTPVVGPVSAMEGAAGTVHARVLAVFVDREGVPRRSMCIQLQRSNLPAAPGADPRDNPWFLGSTVTGPAAAEEIGRALALACH